MTGNGTDPNIHHIELPVKDSRHTVVATYDPVERVVVDARVVDGDSGVRHLPDDGTLVALANMFIAKQVANDSLLAAESKKEEINKFGPAVKALPITNPAVQPHYKELAEHEKIYSDYKALETFLQHKVERGALHTIAEHEPKLGETQHGLDFIAKPLSSGKGSSRA